ncbi:MAG: hypothetical protein IJS54_06840 [Desulfovibrio sp.]|nr:hypothetical protein [Desulfovibrio sp.]
MADTNEEIIDLTELIERGTVQPDSQGTTGQSQGDAEQGQGDADLDMLMAQIGADPKTDKKSSFDPHEQIDMSSIDEIDDLIGDLQMHGRNEEPPKPKAAAAPEEPQQPQNDIQESVNNDLNDLLAAIDAESLQMQERKKAQKEENASVPPQADANSDINPMDDIDTLLQQMEQKPAESDLATPNASQSPETMQDLDALLGSEAQAESAPSDREKTAQSETPPNGDTESLNVNAAPTTTDSHDIPLAQAVPTKEEAQKPKTDEKQAFADLLPQDFEPKETSSKAAIAQLEQRIEELESSVTLRMTDCEQRVKALAENIQTTITGTVQDAIAALKEECQSLFAKESDNAANKEALEALTASQNESKEHIDALAANLTACETNLSEKINAIEMPAPFDPQSLRDEFATTLETLRQTSEELSAKIAQLEEGLPQADLPDRVHSLEDALATLSETIANQAANAQAFTEHADQQIEEIHTRLATFAQDNQSAQKAIVKSLSGRITTMQGDIDQLAAREIPDQAAIAQQIADLPQVSEETIDAKIETLRSQNDEALAEIITRIDAVTESLAELSARPVPNVDEITANVLANIPQNPDTVTREELAEQVAPLCDQIKDLAVQVADAKAPMEQVETLLDAKLAALPTAITKDALEERLAAILAATEATQTDLAGRIDAINEQMQSLASQESAPALDALKHALLTSLEEQLTSMLDEKLAQLNLLTTQDLEERLAPILAATEATQTDLAGRIDAINEQMQQGAAANTQDPSQFADLLAEKLASVQEATNQAIDEKLAPLNDNVQSLLQAADTPSGITTEELEARLAEIVQATERSIADVVLRMDALPAQIQSQELNLDTVLDPKLTSLANDLRQELEGRLAPIQDAVAALTESIHAAPSSDIDLEALQESLQGVLLAQLSDVIKPVFEEKLDKIQAQTEADIETRLSPIQSALDTLATNIAQRNQQLPSEALQKHIEEFISTKFADANEHIAEHLAAISPITREDLEDRMAKLLATTEANQADLADLAARIDTLANKDTQPELQALSDHVKALAAKTREELKEELEERLRPLQESVAHLASTNAIEHFADKLLTREELEDRITPILNATEQSQADFVTLFTALNEKIQELAERNPSVEDVEKALQAKIDDLPLVDEEKLAERFATVFAANTDLASRIEALHKELETQDHSELLAKVDQKLGELNQGVSEEELNQRLLPVVDATKGVADKLDTMASDLQKVEGRIQSMMESEGTKQREALDAVMDSVKRERSIEEARVDSLEKRIDALEPTFNARIDKAAAGATARILREELRQLLEAVY